MSVCVCVCVRERERERERGERESPEKPFYGHRAVLIKAHIWKSSLVIIVCSLVMY